MVEVLLVGVAQRGVIQCGVDEIEIEKKKVEAFTFERVGDVTVAEMFGVRCLWSGVQEENRRVLPDAEMDEKLFTKFVLIDGRWSIGFQFNAMSVIC